MKTGPHNRAHLNLGDSKHPSYLSRIHHEYMRMHSSSRSANLVPRTRRPPSSRRLGWPFPRCPILLYTNHQSPHHSKSNPTPFTTYSSTYPFPLFPTPNPASPQTTLPQKCPQNPNPRHNCPSAPQTSFLSPTQTRFSPWGSWRAVEGNLRDTRVGVA